MKRFATALMALVCVAAGASHWLDLVNYTDLSTGFVNFGPYWIRYALVGGVLLMAALASWMAPNWSVGLSGCTPVQGLLCFPAGIAFGVLAGTRIYEWQAGNGVGRVLTVLYLITSIWFLLLGRCRLSFTSQTPTGSALFGIAGTLSLYLLTLQRFCLEPTGIVRVSNTLSAMAALSALLFCAAQAKAAYLPGKKGGRWLYFTGMTAFLLCSCIALPGAVCGYMVKLVTMPSLIEAAALGIVGLCGLATAFGAAGEPLRNEETLDAQAGEAPENQQPVL